MKSFYLTTPIYYVNARPHLGHAYTTLAADVMHRYYKLSGNDSFFLTGTDEHGSKIAQAAEKNEMDVKNFVDQVSDEFVQAWKSLNISNDVFARTTDEKHKKSVAKFFQKMFDNGDIYEDEYEGLYCVGCERFLTEKELVDGKCPDHKTAPEHIKEKNYFFNLKKYLPKLEELITSDKIQILPESKKNEVLGLLKQDLENFSLSRQQVKWGIPAPFDSSQIIYVWTEALSNYISFIGYESDEKSFDKWWNQSHVIHFMSKDILKFHAIFWPAMLLSAGLKTPDTIFAHGFFTIDGEKMSKTIGNVINPMDLVEQYNVDGARYLILSQFPFGIDGDIKKEKFTELYNAKLANNLGNLVSRVATMTEKYADSRVPKVSEDVFNLSEHWSKYTEHMNGYELYHALKTIDEFVGVCNVYIEEQKPWELAKQNPEKIPEVLYQLLEALYHIALMISPFLPETSQHIFKILGIEQAPEQLEDSKYWGQLKENQIIQKGDPLFLRMQE